MAMIACTPCLLAPVKAGAAVLAGALGFSKLRKLSKKKKRKRNKKTQRGGRKRTNKKRTSKKKQNGGGEMTQEEYDEMRFKVAKRSQHLRDTLNRRRHSRNKIRNLRKTRSASFGGGKKTKRRTRKLKR